MKTIIIIATVLTTVSTATAQTTLWQIDPVHSSITFAVDYMVLTEVTGSFKDFTGTIQREGEDLAKVDVSIKASSIDTDNEKRDDHLRSADFFDVQKFPEITFVSKWFEKGQANSYQITGDLNLHGITKPVVITARYTGQAKDPWGNIRQGFKGTASVNRADFGIQYNSLLEAGGLLIGEDVQVTLNIQFLRQQATVN